MTESEIVYKEIIITNTFIIIKEEVEMGKPNIYFIQKK